jgi:hypothetical protein
VIRKLSYSIDKFATLRVLIILGVVFVIFSVIFVYVDVPFGMQRLEKISGGVRLLDVQRNYSPEMAYNFLEAYGEQGRQVYVRILTADLFYPLLYSIFLSVAMTWLFRRAFKPDNRAQLFNLLPFVVALFDYAENAGLYIMLRNYPTQMVDIATITSYISTIKQVLGNVSVMALAIGFIFYLAREAGLPRPYKTR